MICPSHNNNNNIHISCCCGRLKFRRPLAYLHIHPAHVRHVHRPRTLIYYVQYVMPGIYFRMCDV